MAQLERTQLERTRRSTDSSRTIRAPTSPTFEQLLRVDEAYWSPTTSPVTGIHHGHEEGLMSPSNNNKKSVLSKVKEKAKKLKHTLSGKKNIHENDLNDDNTSTISSGDHNLDDDDDTNNYEEPIQDPEYLGAPMYESEAAPDNLKENARQHPRADPVVCENHRTPNMNKPISEPETAYAALSDATQKITSKITNLIINPPEAQQTAAATAAAAAAAAPQTLSPGYEAKKIRDKDGNVKAYAASSSPHTYDKGVSVKEYFMNKLEPGEDEKALSQAITEAISPRAVTNNTGVVEKVKEAVSSFFWQDAPVFDSVEKPTGFSTSARPMITKSQSSKPLHIDTAKLYPRFSRSATTKEGANLVATREEENHGKILQTN